MTESAETSEVLSFEALADLDSSELRVLIREGRPVEKVWAAWQLAIVAGRDADPALSDALSEEPSAGVRAHWIIVLYSHGESELVSVLAQHDPSALVRETAVRYLAPSADQPKTPALRPALGACMSDDAPRVRQTTLRHLAAAPGPELLERVYSMSSDPDAQVRMAALNYLLRHHCSAEDSIASYTSDVDVHVRRRAIDALVTPESSSLDWSIERLIVEEDEQARERLLEGVIQAELIDALALKLSLRAPLMVHDVFAPLARRSLRFPWSTMAPLMGVCPDSPTLLVLCACLDASTVSEGAAVALIDEATAYYEGEELWLPHLIQITTPLLKALTTERRAGFPALRALLMDELHAARAQRWGPIDKLEALLSLLEE